MFYLMISLMLAPVPVKSAVVEAIEEVHFWSGSSNVWMYLEELQEGTRSAFLGSYDDDIRQSTSSRRRRVVAIFSPIISGCIVCPKCMRSKFTHFVIDIVFHAMPNIVAREIIYTGAQVDVIVRRNDDVIEITRLPERYHVTMTKSTDADNGCPVVRS